MRNIDVFARNRLFFSEEEFSILQNAFVAVVGVGGIGCIVSEILVRTGVGKIIIIDKGIIDSPDLGRQSLYLIEDIGKNKVDVAREKLTNTTQRCKVIGYKEDIESSCIHNRFAQVDCVVDCLDNYTSRFILEDCLNDNIYLIHGGVANDFGQVTTIQKGKTQSLKDIYKGLTDEHSTKAVATTSVFIIGSLIAQETINVLLKKPKLLNKILVVELSDFYFNKIQLGG